MKGQPLILGKPFSTSRRLYTLNPEERRLGILVVGKPGMGKSTLLANLCLQDIKADRGVGLLDPHGDLVETLLDYIPRRRIPGCCYFNLADRDFPIAFNLLEPVKKDHRVLVLNGVVGIFKRLFRESWGPRLEYLLSYGLAACLEVPGATLLSLQELLTNSSFRKRWLNQVQDPFVKNFFQEEYDHYPEEFRKEAIAPIQNKVGRFLLNPILRNMICQSQTRVKLREIMDREGILLANLSKGLAGAEASELLGAALLVQFLNGALSRQDQSEPERKEFTLYLDELSSFATETLTELFSQARKYHLALVVASSSLAGLEKDLRSTLLANIGSIVAFRVGPEDGELLAKEFQPDFERRDFINLGKHQIIFKPMHQGIPVRPYRKGVTLPWPNRPGVSHRQKIIRLSRQNYAQPRQIVEAKLAKRLQHKLNLPI